MMFQNGQKKMLIDRQQQAQRQIQDNAKAQQESAVISEEEKRKTFEKELEVKQAIAGFEGNNKLQELIITMAATSLGKEGSIPPEWKATVDGVMKKVQVQLGIEAEQEQEQFQSEMQEPPQQQQMERQQGIEQPVEQQEQTVEEQQTVLM
jgi:hypothetical protein